MEWTCSTHQYPIVKMDFSLNLNWYQLFSAGGGCSLFDYRPLSLDFFPTLPFLFIWRPLHLYNGVAPPLRKRLRGMNSQQWKLPANVMQIYYESSQKYTFTTLWQAYKIAICLTVCAILMYSKPWVLSTSVSQIIQTFKGKVNIKHCLFHNMQSGCLLFLLSPPVWSRNT